MGSQRELALIEAWQSKGDSAARRELTETFMPRVKAIARSYRHYPIDVEDLTAEGSIGLLVAIDRFEPSKNVRLMTYASHWIRAYIVNAVIKAWGRGKTGMGVTRSRMFFRVRRERARYASQHVDQSVIVSKMASDIGVSEKRMRDMFHAIDTPDFSLDAYAETSGQADLKDRIVDTAASPLDQVAGTEHTFEYSQAIALALGTLNDRERLIARKRLMEEEPMTLADLGREIGVSRERARQLELRTKRKIAKILEGAGITGEGFRAQLA